jgi:ABC-2 type transport system ATP-binding protein
LTIHVQDLTKEFRRYMRKEGSFAALRNLFGTEYNTLRAVDDVSFDIGEGELVGYIGPNGAGKSTSIKMMTGILVPTSGVVEVNGISPQRDRVRNARQIGVVFGQKTQLWWDVPVIESLRLLRDIYKVPEAQFQRNLALFSDLLDIDRFWHTPVRQLSLGQRMRADLAAAFLHNPKVLFLDEPTIGMDVVAKERLRQFIREINRQEKVTVLLTTHDMTDIEKLCSRLMIIDRGQLIYDGSLERLRLTHAQHRTLIIEFETELGDFSVPGAELIRTEGRRKWFRFNRLETSPSDLIMFMGSRYPVVDLTVEEPEIEATVREIYQGTAAGLREVAP